MVLCFILIFLVIPISAVYELWNGAKRDRQIINFKRKHLLENDCDEDVLNRTIGVIDDIYEMEELLKRLNGGDRSLTAVALDESYEMIHIKHSTIYEMHDNPLNCMSMMEKDNGIAPGWEELVDQTTGKLYYYELSTFITVWLKEDTWTFSTAEPKVSTKKKKGRGSKKNLPSQKRKK